MTLNYFLILSAIIFAIGLFGVITRRNIIGILMSIELMFNAANINFAALNKFLYTNTPLGQLMVIFIITVAACEVVVGLALIVAIYRNLETLQVEKYNILKG